MMPPAIDHDVEAGNPISGTKPKLTMPLHPMRMKGLAKMPTELQQKPGLMAMARMFLSMVCESKVEEATGMIDQMRAQGYNENKGFAIHDPAGNGILQIAALKNDRSMTERLLSKGFDINYVDDNHGTALQAAIYMDSEAVVNQLLNPLILPQPAEVNTQGGYYGCALQVAAFKGSEKYIAQLIKQGADTDVCIGKSKYGTALQAAARTGLPSVLNQILGLKSVDVNAQGGVYGTALEAAAKGNYTGATKYLRQLSRGRVLRQALKVPRKATNGTTDYVEVARMLIEGGAKVNASGGRLESPVNAAASSGDPGMLKLLLDNDDPALEGQETVYGRALLSAITQTINKKRIDLVKLLLFPGGKVNINFQARDSLHNSPLTAAAVVNDTEVVEYLLKMAGDKKKDLMVRESGIYGSALRAALSAPEPAEGTALYLIGEKAHLAEEDPSYENILHLAAFANLNKVVEELLSGIDHVEVNALDKNDQTALHVAAYCGREKIVSTLIKYGAKVDLKDVWGNTPLDTVEDVMGKETHPVPSLQDLRKIKEILSQHYTHNDKQQTVGLFPGPHLTKQLQNSSSTVQKARPVFQSPKWNPGLNFQATIVDFLAKGEDQEYVFVKHLPIDDLLYRDGAVEETMKTEDPEYILNLRWIHLPTNNMTWAEMLMSIYWPKAYEDTTCKTIWGTDPYFVSPDLAPHARFVTPQCGRLIPESSGGITPSVTSPAKPLDTLFLAMPYIHWESYSGQLEVARLLDNIKERTSKTRIWSARNTWRAEDWSRPRTSEEDIPKEEPGDTTNTRVTDYDDELLDKYLFKRWPLHLRRTLDQYYYSYLADTKTRDSDQVAMRARERKMRQDAENIKQYLREHTKEDAQAKKQKPKSKKEPLPAKAKEEALKHDGDSPVIMVDQLWLWIVDKNLIITSFPQRRSDRAGGDLDPEDKTDVLKTLIAYLHSAKRRPIRDAYDLCELIVSQTVGILHRSDMIHELDFLKIFATQADWAMDQVMTGLTEFTTNFKEFMIWLKKKKHTSEEYVRQFEKLFSVTDETALLREVQDMRDELNMLAAVFSDQITVLERAGKDIEKNHGAGLNPHLSGKDIENNRGAGLNPHLSGFAFQQQSEKHRRHIKRMQDQADQAYMSLKDLLNLKQQQANVLEARVNRNQAIAAREQGKTIMVFTIVTIIFLPLTFMTTVFTLPVLDFPRLDPMSLEPSPSGLLRGKFVFSIIAGFTLAFAIPLVIAAFEIRFLLAFWERAMVSVERVFPLRSAGAEEIPEPEDG